MANYETLAVERTQGASDFRRRSRFFAAMMIPVGPFAVAALRYLLPYNTVDKPAAMFAKVSADPGRQSIVIWLALVAVLTLVPSVMWVGRLLRRRAPRLTAAAVLLSVAGYLSLGWLVSLDLMLLSGAQAGTDAGTMNRLLAAGHPTTGVAAGFFVLGHVLGTVLLGIAMLRSKMVPAWAAVMTIVSQPLHFVAAVIVASPLLDLFAWGMNGLGFAAAALAILRLSDDKWDLPPLLAG